MPAAGHRQMAGKGPKNPRVCRCPWPLPGQGPHPGWPPQRLGRDPRTLGCVVALGFYRAKGRIPAGPRKRTGKGPDDPRCRLVLASCGRSWPWGTRLASARGPGSSWDTRFFISSGGTFCVLVPSRGQGSVIISKFHRRPLVSPLLHSPN